MSETFSPPPRVSDPNMHHDTCVAHVPWCMPGSLTSGFLRWRGKRFRHSRRLRNSQFCVSGKRPMVQNWYIVVNLNKLWNKQSSFWKTETIWRPWEVNVMTISQCYQFIPVNFQLRSFMTAGFWPFKVCNPLVSISTSRIAWTLILVIWTSNSDGRDL